MRNRTDLRLHLALIFVQVTFGALHVFGKGVLHSIEPLAVASTRILVSVPLLLALALRVERKIPSLADLARLAGLGFLGVFCNQLFYILGLERTTATNAGILMLSIPVFVALIAGMGGMERLTGAGASGVALAVAGAFAMMDWGRADFTGGTIQGNALLLVNCLAYAFYLVLQRPMLERLHPLTVVAWAFLFGGAGVLAVSLPAFLRMDVAAVPPLAWLGLAYIAVIPSGVNYALNTWALRRSSAALVATYTTLQPIAAALLAALILKERPSWQEAAGFALITAGLWLVSGQRKAKSEMRIAN
jgi:drug/metabolite transporter (DMT)-like permease